MGLLKVMKKRKNVSTKLYLEKDIVYNICVSRCVAGGQSMTLPPLIIRTVTSRNE